MSLTIELTPDLEVALHALAQSQGVDLESLVLRTLREQLSRSARPIPRDDWERRLIDAGVACGVTMTHDELSCEGLYE